MSEQRAVEVKFTVDAEAEATGRVRLEWVASLFDASRLVRRRFDPRRLSDRFVACACRRWIARSVAAGENAKR